MEQMFQDPMLGMFKDKVEGFITGDPSFTSVHIFHTFSEKCLELRFQEHIDQIPCILVDSSL